MSDYTIRPIEERDLRLLLEWRNSERIHSKMLTDHKITWEEHCAWFQHIKSERIKRNFIFEYKEKPIGYLGYTEFDMAEKRCSPGAYLGTDNVPMDAGLMLFYTVIEYAFEKLGMESLETSVFNNNKKVIKMDKLFGYRIISKYECEKNGTLEKTVRMRLTRKDWILNKGKFGMEDK